MVIWRLPVFGWNIKLTFMDIFNDTNEVNGDQAQCYEEN